MRDSLSSLSSDRVPEVAVALALGYAFVTLVDTFVRVPVSVLAQRVGDDPYDEGDSVFGLVDLVSEPYSLNFSIGKTVVAYGPVLVAVLALGLVALGGVLVTRRDRVLDECPFCASCIPYASTHCAYCGSGVEPVEPVDT